MRVWGRLPDGTWVAVTEPSYVRLTQLIQTLKLELGESPLNGAVGIPSQVSVNTQIAPDAAVARTQVQFSQYFASLTVARDNTVETPTYNIGCVFTDGTVIQATVAT